MLCTLALNARQGEKTKPPKSNDEIIQELSNDPRYSYEDLLHGNPGAVANAKKAFELSNDPLLKQRLASILLAVGVKDKSYQIYLEHAAREALADKTPWPICYRDKEKYDWNPVFLEWCKKRDLDPLETLKRVHYEVPAPWTYLAAAGDPAFYKLLIEGLSSQNQYIVAMAARGLAKLQDSGAVDSLIAAGRRALPEGRFGIGESLLYFQDPKAQSAADEFLAATVTKEHAENLRKAAREKGLKNLFDW